ncbi:MAG: hypothetical protein R6W93_06550, partial [Candidatus Limnocylindrales bacterium]
MIRTSFIVLVLAALLLPETVLAVDEPLPSPSPATVGAAAADASPGASLLPAEPVSVILGPRSDSAQPPPEPDFLVGEWELQAVPWPKLRLNGGRALPIRTEGPQDADGV